MPTFDEKILGLVSREDYRPITMKAMCEEVKLEPDDYAEFRAVVKTLVREGKLTLAKDKTLSKPTGAAKGLIIGSFRRSSRRLWIRSPATLHEQGQGHIHPAQRRSGCINRRPCFGENPEASSRAG